MGYNKGHSEVKTHEQDILERTYDAYFPSYI